LLSINWKHLKTFETVEKKGHCWEGSCSLFIRFTHLQRRDIVGEDLVLFVCSEEMKRRI
jgi:hypothetical protein